LSRLLMAAYAKGCQFDGWSDQFNYGLWQEAIAEAGIDAQFFTARARDVAEPLPWDHIDSRVSRSFLKQEWTNALEQNLIEDCRRGSCHQCGTCDFEKIEPRTYATFDEKSDPGCDLPPAAIADFKSLCVFYAKQDQAKYFGHLEMVNIFLRALKRAKIPVQFSQGFHPKPKISFDDPLPIGIESEQERFILSVPDSVNPATVARSLNSHLPDGLVITSSQFVTAGFKRQVAGTSVYRVTLQDGTFNEESLRSFKNSAEAIISRSNRKGKLKKINLKDMVTRIELLNSKQLQVALAAETGKTLRPAQILGPIFGIPENQIKQARVVKLNGVNQDVQAAHHQCRGT
jgi:radical SAM-linked protein